MNPTILPTRLIAGQTVLFNLGMATGLGENSEFKPVVDLERNGLRYAIPAQDTLYEYQRLNQVTGPIVIVVVVIKIKNKFGH